MKPRTVSKWRAWLEDEGYLKRDGWVGKSMRFLVAVPEDWIERRAAARIKRYRPEPEPALEPEACAPESHDVPPTVAPRATEPPAIPQGRIDQVWRELVTIYPRVGDAEQMRAARRALRDACALAGGAEKLLGAARAQQAELQKRLRNPGKKKAAPCW